MNIENSEEQRETAENSKALRCFFDTSPSTDQGFLPRRADPPL